MVQEKEMTMASYSLTSTWEHAYTINKSINGK